MKSMISRLIVKNQDSLESEEEMVYLTDPASSLTRGSSGPWVEWSYYNHAH